NHYSPAGRLQRVVGVAIDVTERRRAEEAERLSQETQKAILDALPAHVALLDKGGVIRAVNEAWTRPGQASLWLGTEAGVGTNYLGTCETFRGEGVDDARAVAGGIRAVLAGRLPHFEREYPCPRPGEKRWFRV